MHVKYLISTDRFGEFDFCSIKLALTGFYWISMSIKLKCIRFGWVACMNIIQSCISTANEILCTHWTANGWITPWLLVYSYEQQKATSQMCLTFWWLCHRSCSEPSSRLVFILISPIHWGCFYYGCSTFCQCRRTVYTRAFYSSIVFLFGNIVVFTSIQTHISFLYMSQSHFCCWFSMKLKIQRVNGVPLFDRFISFFITCMWHNDKYISATLKLNDDEVTDLCLWLNTFILITLTPFACDHSRENVKIQTIFIRYQCKQGILYDINNNKKSAAITTKMTWYLQEYVISCWLLRFYCKFHHFP